MHDSDIVLHGISSEPPVLEEVPRGSKNFIAPEYDSNEGRDENVSIYATYLNRETNCMLGCQNDHWRTSTCASSLDPVPVAEAQKVFR